MIVYLPFNLCKLQFIQVKMHVIVGTPFYKDTDTFNYAFTTPSLD